MKSTVGRDQYGAFVLFGDFRSAMPDDATAKRAAASDALLEVLIELVQFAERQPGVPNCIPRAWAAIARAGGEVPKPPPRRRPRHGGVEPDYGGVLGADGQVYSDADPGL